MQFVAILTNAFVAAIVLGGLLAWGWILSCARRGIDPLPYEPRRPVPWQAIDLLVVIAILLLTNVAYIEIAARIAGSRLPADPKDFDSDQRLRGLLIQVATYLTTVVLAIAFIASRSGATARDFGFDRLRIGSDLKIGAIAFFAVAPVIFAIQAALTWLLPYQHPVLELVNEHPGTLALTLTTFSTVVVAPFVEEFIFRVLLQGVLEKAEWSWRMKSAAAVPEQGDSLASAHGNTVTSDEFRPDLLPQRRLVAPGFLPIVVSSLVFALMHWGQGPAMVPLFVLALVLGTLYHRTHRIVPSLTVHALLNGISMALLLAGADA